MSQRHHLFVVPGGFRAVAVLVSLLVGVGFFPGGGLVAGAQPVPSPVIVVVDTNRILRESTAAQGILQQIETLNRDLQAEATGREEQLQIDRQELEKQRSVLTSDAFQARVREFEDRLREIQREIQDKNRQIATSMQIANLDLRAALEPILRDIMTARGANILFEKGRVAYNVPEMDVTEDALQRLNAATPRITVQFPPPPQQ